MQNMNYRSLLYFISLVIAVTLAIQLYWNYKNYQAGLHRLANEVQSSVDNAIDAYYIDLAEKNTVDFTVPGGALDIRAASLDSLLSTVDGGKNRFSIRDSTYVTKTARIEVLSGAELKESMRFNPVTSFSPVQVGNSARADSIKGLISLTSRIFVAITTDTLNTPELNTYIDEQLEAKNLDVNYAYIFKNNSGNTQVHNLEIMEETALSTTAKSAYLPKNSNFKLYFTNVTSTVLKRNLLGLSLSAILVAAVVACLFFLLRIINRQKELAEVKNDLISNITHEFKTPISTVKVALEGIQNFNIENDPVKTRNYLQMSHTQLDKLQMMVEKLLETATLDGDRIKLQKEELNVGSLLEELVEKHQNLAPEKTFSFFSEAPEMFLKADAFHLENALNNILDNAVKYGGDKIEVQVKTENDLLKITITDDGKSLTKTEAEQLFEKFYRVPKGNLHNIKGYGIGLYYTKKIIEKHGGTIKLNLNGATSFIIRLPHE